MNPIKILILEDNPQEAQLLKLLLSENYDIVGPAHNLKEAQELLEKEVFDLAILDIYIGNETH